MVHNYQPHAAKSHAPEQYKGNVSAQIFGVIWRVIFEVKKLRRTKKFMFITHLLIPYLNIYY
jgi:hypothetical protein